ncbi:hypothetical protein JXA63_01935 [Candidatus Woesebacteria bacterium]|nr:hypothetical protein [Candidatus Woesebacteria bacterium]
MSKKGDKNKKEKSMSDVSDQKQEKSKMIKNTLKKKKNRFSKIYMFIITDIIVFALLFFFLGLVRKKAVALNGLINTYQNAQRSSQVNFADLEIKSNKEKADKIVELFPNEKKFLEFIKIIEEKSGDGGSVVNFTFATKEPVRDSTTRLGIPVVVNFKGSWGQIDKDLRDIQSAPFLFRPITIEAKNTAEEGVVELMYGGFLYIDESF